MLISVVKRLVVMAVLWLAVTEAASGALGYGAVIVPVVTAATYVIVPARSRRGVGHLVSRATGVVGLVGWILARSLVGGADVARRAFTLPRTDVDPEWMTYRTTLTTRAGRVGLALVMNLMPGSLSAGLDGDLLEVHVISSGMDVHEQLGALEKRIARIEGVDPSGGSRAGRA